ncbi:MAG: methionyl-tRNA synthetase, methionyl-tRNA synthetase [Armatimonadetes bacterium CSP1-3]|nr:MAG: methionyl-tRNA synthetase, methionyl-tRNA synthetase [Armatimonadetes bacterium CSP1-3]
MDYISIDDFKRLDIRVGEILSATRVPGTDKLIELEVNIGSEVRHLITGIYPLYRPVDLVGRRIIVLANLQPRRVKGVESQGMLLAAEWDGEIGLLTVDKDTPSGARIT